MEKYQQILEGQLSELLRPDKLLAHLIAKRLIEMGIKLDKKQLTSIQKQLRQKDGDEFSFNLQIKDEQIASAGFVSEDAARKALTASLANLVSDADEFISELIDNLPRIIGGGIRESAPIILRSLKRTSQVMLDQRRHDILEFENRLYQKWHKALDLLELLLAMSREAGNHFNAEYRLAAANNKDYVFDVLTRLHARACQVASEILVLLRTGHADGAHARWRCLHEIAVIAVFIGKHDADLAERYLLHKDVESFKAANQYQVYCKRLGFDPMSEEDLSYLKKRHQALLDRYGKSYENDYGWSSQIISKERPTFSDIERVVGLDYIRPYYRMASHNIHANPKGVFFKLGLYPDSENIMLAGPSNMGLADPGQSCGLSLTQITVTLLTLRHNIDNLVICDMLRLLNEEVGQAFMKAHDKMLRSAKKKATKGEVNGVTS